jgi:anti-sigma regulatory factor (Ser/Thr protein kinase)
MMTPRNVEVLSTELPGDQRAPQTVRRALEALELPVLSSDVLLVASELVSNAVRHSGCGPDEPIKVRAYTDGARITVSVNDPGRSGLDAQVRSDDDTAHGCFGLRIVERLCTRWGADRSCGYRVWAELAPAGTNR